MQTRFLVPFFALGVAAFAADKKPAAAAPPNLGRLTTEPKTDEFAAYKDADALWKHVEETREKPTVQPKSQEEMTAIVTKWLSGQKTAADAFISRYPDDPRHYGAQLVSLQTGLQLARIPGANPGPLADPTAVKKQLAEIAAAPDAPEGVRGEATFVQTIALSGDVDVNKPETVSAFFKASDDFLARYGSHPLAPQMRVAQLQLAGSAKTPEADAMLVKLAASDDTRLADAAKKSIASKARMAGLRTRPVDLKFTSADGQEVSLQALRGKVVLIDFWASWCAPCIAEMPNLVATYKKLHGQGFEIVGISLDQDKEAMEAALKKHGMTWKQYFDGKGWSNEISTSFGITALPAALLIDRLGLLRESNLRGDALGKSVEKLLAE